MAFYKSEIVCKSPTTTSHLTQDDLPRHLIDLLHNTFHQFYAIFILLSLIWRIMWTFSKMKMPIDLAVTHLVPDLDSTLKLTSQPSPTLIDTSPTPPPLNSDLILNSCGLMWIKLGIFVMDFLMWRNICTIY